MRLRRSGTQAETPPGLTATVGLSGVVKALSTYSSRFTLPSRYGLDGKSRKLALSL